MIAIEVDDRAVLDALGQLMQRVEHPAPAFAAVGEALKSNIQGGFSDSTDPWGGAWQALSQTTQSIRGGRRMGGQPLLDTGKLRNSINYFADDGGVEIGTADTEGKALMQQFGGHSKLFKASVPARPFLPIRNGTADLPPAWQDEVMAIIQKFITGE